jgi:hypothetical protein
MRLHRLRKDSYAVQSTFSHLSHTTAIVSDLKDKGIRFRSGYNEMPLPFRDKDLSVPNNRRVVQFCYIVLVLRDH